MSKVSIFADGVEIEYSILKVRNQSSLALNVVGATKIENTTMYLRESR